MDAEEAAEYAKTDPNCTAVEKEFSVGFSKDHERATFHAAIGSMVKRTILNTDMKVEEITVYDEDSESYEYMSVEEFDGGGRIVQSKGKVPIESLKVRSSPRKHRSFAQVISKQEDVDFDG